MGGGINRGEPDGTREELLVVGSGREIKSPSRTAVDVG